MNGRRLLRIANAAASRYRHLGEWDDLVGDACYGACLAVTRFDGRGDLYPYVSLQAKRAVIDGARSRTDGHKRTLQTKTISVAEPPDIAVEDPTEKILDRLILHQALEACTDLEKTCLLWPGTATELAQRRGTSVAVVSRARSRGFEKVMSAARAIMEGEPTMLQWHRDPAGYYYRRPEMIRGEPYDVIRRKGAKKWVGWTNHGAVFVGEFDTLAEAQYAVNEARKAA